MPECEVCGCEDFAELLGHFYCSNCQTQSQTVRVVEAEDEYAQWSGHANRIREKNLTEKSKDTGKDEGRPWSVFEAYQIIIQHQTEALIQLGANKALKDVVFEIWANYLSKISVAFSDRPALEILKKYSVQREMYPGTTKKPLTKNVTGRKKRRTTVGVSTKTAEKMQAAREMNDLLRNESFYEEDNPLADDADDGPSTDYYSSEEDEEDTKWGKRGRSVQYLSAFKMQMKYTLVFCYIGLMYTNPGTTVSELIRWARRGEIPYLNAVSLLPEDFKFNLQDSRMFGLGILPSVQYMRRAVGVMCRFLDLEEFPVFPVTELISKYILKLDLPAELIAVASNLYKSKSVVTHYKPAKQYNRLPFWEGLALAYIIITLKLYLGLDDQTERLLSSYTRILLKLIDQSHPLFVWEDWVKHINIKFNSSSISVAASKCNEDIRHAITKDKLYQPEVREKIVEPLVKLEKVWKSRRTEGRMQGQDDRTTDDNPSDSPSNDNLDNDPVGCLLGYYNENSQHEPEAGDITLKANNNEVKLSGEQFRRSSLKHLSNPESYLEDLDKYGLSDYTIQSVSGNSEKSHEEIEPTNTGLDSNLSADEPDSNQDSQSTPLTFLQQFIKKNIRVTPSSSKVTDKENYEHVTNQIKKVHEYFLLTFEPGQRPCSLSYNWLLHVCSELISCPILDLRTEVKKVEVCLFAESEDISQKGRYNFKRMKKRKLNDFTKTLKVF